MNLCGETLRKQTVSKLTKYCDVTGLLTAGGRSHSGHLVWVGQEGGGVIYSEHICVISRSLPVADNLINKDKVAHSLHIIDESGTQKCV